MTTRMALLLGLAAALAGCGSSDPVLMDPDAGPEPETDAGPEPETDAGPEPETDAGEPETDAGPDPDAGPPPIVCDDDPPAVPDDPAAGAWEPDFNLPGVGGTAPLDVLALAVGPSDEVYVGGQFSHAGATPAANVAKWTTAGWETLGGGIEGDVLALAVHPSGSPVYAAAEMHSTWEVEILAFDGTDWRSLTVVGGYVDDLQVGSDGTLYVAGWFTGIGGDDTIEHFAVYDGTTWGVLEGNPDSDVSTVLVGASGVCIGGSFTEVARTAAQNVACWNGTAWVGYDIPVDYHEVKVLARDAGGSLLAGGHFVLDDDDATTGHSLARWTGSAWEYLGGGVHGFDAGSPGTVEGIAVVGSDIYVGGYFTQVGPTADYSRMQDVARWDGSTWHDLGGAERHMGLGLTSQNVRHVVADSSGNVYFGGMFSVVADRSASHVAMWDGTYWNTLTSPGQLDAGINGLVNVLAARGDCGVYAAGDFRFAGDVVANDVAKLTDTGWEALGEGVRGDGVFALAVAPDGSVYAGGDFVGPGFYYLAKFDGTSWGAVDGNVMGVVHALAVDEDGNLFVSGDFLVAGDISANYIAMHDGTDWHTLGEGLDGSARVMTFDPDGNLVVAGQFQNAGGEAASNIAMWDGSAWHAYGDGLPGAYAYVRSLTFHGGQLLAGGNFDALPDGSKGVAVWDGTAWTGFGGGLFSESPWSGPYVNGLASVGDHLFAAGWFSLEAGVESVGLAYWDGSRWTAMGDGVNDIAEDAIATTEGVYVGGTFNKVDRTPSSAIGLWRFAE